MQKPKFKTDGKTKPKVAGKSKSDQPKTKVEHRGSWVKRPPKGQFEPDPKDANTVNALRAKLAELREYKRILAQDGLKPDEDDKKRESDIIVQLIRIEKGLPPTKPSKKTKKKTKKKNVADKAAEKGKDLSPKKGVRPEPARRGKFSSRRED